ncbi:MAG TPA: nitroreductase family protein [bacterium]|nr:nitroreductase family protein [bacterium]
MSLNQESMGSDCREGISPVIRRRFSCRTYSEKGIEEEKKKLLRDYINENKEGPFGNRIFFYFVDKNKYGEPLGSVITCGVIKGARYFISGTLKKTERAEEDFGYAMEKNILFATGLGLGTCWLGGTFSRSRFADLTGLAEGDFIPAVTPVGYPAGKRTLLDRAIAFSASSRKRKPRDKIFFFGDISRPLSENSAGAYSGALECVRLAPSASNRQPWRVIKETGAPVFHFFLRRMPLYGSLVPGVDLQRLDMGIAMCHFELSAEESGLCGKWILDFQPPQRAGGAEYVISWTGERQEVQEL